MVVLEKVYVHIYIYITLEHRVMLGIYFKFSAGVKPFRHLELPSMLTPRSAEMVGNCSYLTQS